MKRLFNLMAMAIIAAALFSGCQKYDDTQIRQQIGDLGERVAKLEAWSRDSQEAIDNVAVLKEAIKNINSIESVDTFEDGTGSGYVITFTNKKSIKLYNGEDGDAFFGNVNVGSSSVEFILADGTRFVVDRVTNSIGFDSYDTKTVAIGDTIWTVMNEKFTKSEFAAFTAEIKSNDGTAISVVTKSESTEAEEWKIEAIAPEFNEDGSLARPAGVVIADAPEAGAKGVLKVALVANNGKETASSLVIDIALDYLSFRAVEAGATVSMEIVGQCDAPSLEYSTDLQKWTKFDFSNPQTIILENVGDKVYWRNTDKTDHFSSDADNYVHFKLGDKKIAASGNIMSLIDNSCESLAIPSEGCFRLLFFSCKYLTEAPEMPAVTLAPYCYRAMFQQCQSLETVHELPATEMATGCYYALFLECSSLKNAPELPALKLAPECYLNMFNSCSSLSQAPELPANDLKSNCYYGMFTNCTELRKAPRLDALNLARECYRFMFEGCTALEEAPELPATKTDVLCYGSMFSKCYSLESAPALLPATVIADSCYRQMFSRCISLKKAPELPAKELASGCYQGMFMYSSLEEAPELPATKLAPQCYQLMFRDCYSLGKGPSALPAEKLDVECCHGMFYSCTSLESAPEMAATELAESCCFGMFEGCSSLESAPKLPATAIAFNCYCNMFKDCYSLKAMPELPATELAELCYCQMFFNCQSLAKVSSLPATTIAPSCYSYMFYNCTSLKTAPEKLPAENLAASCYSCMFFECTSLETAPELPATELASDCYSYMFTDCEFLTEAPALPATKLEEYCYAVMFANCKSLEKAPELPAEHLALACYESMFEGCEKINYVKVGFTDWGDGYMTRYWLDGAAPEGSFEGPETLGAKYGQNYIPEGWTFNGRSPEVAANNFAVPATKSVRSSLRKPLAPKTLEIMDRDVERDMITL